MLCLNRWTGAFSGFMPPFRSWMPPAVIAEAAAWGDSLLGADSMGASTEELSALKYSFPDALPKVGALDLFAPDPLCSLHKSPLIGM